MAEIKLTGVNKVYPGGTHAVHDVDLHIQDGEFMIMVGPSGCAKSTILRMIAGLEQITAGTLEIGGRVMNDVAPKDRDIAMVFQSYALYPHMTVRDNMSFGLRLRKMPDAEIQQRVMEAARILGLEPLLDRLPKAMSGGQRQRVAMGRAIVREPQAFLMDEPLSNLDAKLRVQMRTEIAKLHARLQTTTVYVTHDQVEAMTLGQRICILRQGVVQQVDTPFEVYTNPNNIFVGGFIGSPGMNFLTGQLLVLDGHVYLELGEHRIPLPGSVTDRLLSSTDTNGRRVVVGIRPEHLKPASPHDPGHALPVDVELVEAMGSDVYAYFTTDIPSPDLSALSDTQGSSATFVARLDPHTRARSGEPLWLCMDLNHLHLFDPESQLSLLARIGADDLRSLREPVSVSTASDAERAALAPRPALHGSLPAEAVEPGSPRIEHVFDAPIGATLGREFRAGEVLAAAGQTQPPAAQPRQVTPAVAVRLNPAFSRGGPMEHDAQTSFRSLARPIVVEALPSSAAGPDAQGARNVEAALQARSGLAVPSLRASALSMPKLFQSRGLLPGADLAPHRPGSDADLTDRPT